jgi:hypothetical protein
MAQPAQVASLAIDLEKITMIQTTEVGLSRHTKMLEDSDALGLWAGMHNINFPRNRWINPFLNDLRS